MNFISTRGICKDEVSSAYAIKTGLAPDGGLYMPTDIPALEVGELRELSKMTYPERAARIIGKFLTDYTEDELLEDALGAYSGDKFGAHPAPVSKVDGERYILELWHGPTCAFKDMALQIMPRLFVRALKKTGEDRTALILVATSGDTGKAALEGYRDVDGTKIQVFYPTDGVSRVQKLQMQTQEGKNVCVKAIVGNFDDAQNGVKRIFSDAAMKQSLGEAGVFLSSANSINFGRLVPQIVYYVSAYCDMVSTGEIEFGDKIDVCVPTGNFGNIFAAYIAKLMGLPIERLVCASNKNDVLTEFLTSGVYNRTRPFFATISPSMDILISSNLERLLYITLGQEKTREYMEKLKDEGKYTLTTEDFATIREHFVGYSADEDETRAMISKLYKEKNCLIDTHTAVAAVAQEKYARAEKAERKILIASTASPYKFARDVYTSIFGTENAPDDLESLEKLASQTGTQIPTPLASLLTKAPRHTDIIELGGMDKAVADFAKA
ncbi:MAG: threonine synthase [Clostridia bacterium]|nr:threonine synthase [Clostridia bacterium]